jgi:hypothetical protein
MSSDTVKRLRDAEAMILCVDGDRDGDFRSELLVEQALAVATELKQSADRIEALEGEVAQSLPWKLFYKDGLDLKQIGERLNVDPYGLSPWLYAPLLKQQGHPYESALKASEARAERLRVALAEVMEWLKNWEPSFMQDGEWAATELKARKALEDDKTQ